MSIRRRWFRWLLRALVALLIITIVLFSATWVYAAGVSALLRSQGVYASAEDGMRALIARSYLHPTDTQIIYAGTNSWDGSQPHVWYVIACVWGGRRADGSPVGTPKHVYDQPGTFFIDTRDGWVFAPEGVFPEWLGFWMQFYGLAGPGSRTPPTTGAQLRAGAVSSDPS